MDEVTHQVLGDCEIDSSVEICAGAVIGKRYRPLVGTRDDASYERTVIGPSAYVGYHTIVGAGCILGEGVVLDDLVVLECDVDVGSETLVIYRAQVCSEAKIGAGCVIGGFVAERVQVGDRCRVFGQIVHSQHDPSVPWDSMSSMEPSAVLENDVFIGFNAIVIGGVRIARNSYVCAGSIITRDVPAQHIAYGINQVIPFREWRGELRKSPFFVPREIDR